MGYGETGEIGKMSGVTWRKGSKSETRKSKSKLQLYHPRVMSKIVKATSATGSMIRDLFVAKIWGPKGQVDLEISHAANY